MADHKQETLKAIQEDVDLAVAQNYGYVTGPDMYDVEEAYDAGLAEGRRQGAFEAEERVTTAILAKLGEWVTFWQEHQERNRKQNDPQAAMRCCIRWCAIVHIADAIECGNWSPR